MVGRRLISGPPFGRLHTLERLARFDRLLSISNLLIKTFGLSLLTNDLLFQPTAKSCVGRKLHRQEVSCIVLGHLSGHDFPLLFPLRR
jgi:hypothetical protein